MSREESFLKVIESIEIFLRVIEIIKEKKFWREWGVYVNELFLVLLEGFIF